MLSELADHRVRSLDPIELGVGHSLRPDAPVPKLPARLLDAFFDDRDVAFHVQRFVGTPAVQRLQWVAELLP